ncbi:hypothetical protein N8D56_20670 [Devosia sp. A8/3-2]|nr:hypothetical protein N8D56_20670 [Devosia sp. A8/3-2]
MKKIAAVLIALSAVGSVGAPAFAATAPQHHCVYHDKSMCHTADGDESPGSTKNN